MKSQAAAWFGRRTSSGHDWDREQLTQRKRGQRISVVLPARNEEATVGDIVATLRRELVHDVPLIDELVVIDSGSEDATAACAAAAGARVVDQATALPRLGDRPGKGEALWKSLAATTGDIIAFIDADLRDFDAQFAVGILGPLLDDPGVEFVKAFYDRPLSTENGIVASGGGRVTELVARPLLNLHWPELAGLIQPLAGEYAGRRHLLENLPFVSGYGVEIGMLIDVIETRGLDAVAQVDLGRRAHRNSPDAALGRMAAQIHLTVLSRIERYDKGVFFCPPSTSLAQFARDGDRFRSATFDVAVSERPPIRHLGEYQQRMESGVA